jgi:threonine aldolase
MAAEAVVIFDPARAWEFELRRKRGGHLFSKMRYIAAQFDALLTDGLWLDLAARANRAAARLAAGLAKVPSVRLLNPVEANMLFLEADRAAHRRAMNAGAVYFFEPFDKSLDGPDEEILPARMVTSWATTDAEIDALLGHLRG